MIYWNIFLFLTLILTVASASSRICLSFFTSSGSFKVLFAKFTAEKVDLNLQLVYTLSITRDIYCHDIGIRSELCFFSCYKYCHVTFSLRVPLSIESLFFIAHILTKRLTIIFLNLVCSCLWFDGERKIEQLDKKSKLDMGSF